MSVSGPTDDNVPEPDAAVTSGDDAPGPAGPPGTDRSASGADTPPAAEEPAADASEGQEDDVRDEPSGQDENAPEADSGDIGDDDRPAETEPPGQEGTAASPPLSASSETGASGQ